MRIATETAAAMTSHGWSRCSSRRRTLDARSMVRRVTSGEPWALFPPERLNLHDSYQIWRPAARLRLAPDFASRARTDCRRRIGRRARARTGRWCRTDRKRRTRDRCGCRAGCRRRCRRGCRRCRPHDRRRRADRWQTWRRHCALRRGRGRARLRRRRSVRARRVDDHRSRRAGCSQDRFSRGWRPVAYGRGGGLPDQRSAGGDPHDGGKDDRGRAPPGHTQRPPGSIRPVADRWRRWQRGGRGVDEREGIAGAREEQTSRAR